MKSLADPTHALQRGLADIRGQFKVPEGFEPRVLEAAEKAARRKPTAHVDRTGVPFVTLDPASSTDLDQAFSIEACGNDLLLHYAIADVAWFVSDGDALDEEAWERGETLYLPDGKASLYPKVLSQGIASLLPDGPRPAVIFTARVNGDGALKLDGAERAVIQSRAKLAYDSVTPHDLPPGFAEFARRMAENEKRRGASRVDPPEQEVEKTGPGRYALRYRPYVLAEEQNAMLSLAANMAIADTLYAHKTGLFRIMADADDVAVVRLRNSAKAFGIAWPVDVDLKSFQTGLDPRDPKQAALMLEIRRAGRGASYSPYEDGETPWHSAMAATYAHATAPLRRLADRYVVMATLAIANGQAVPPALGEVFQRLPKVMGRAGSRSAQLNSAVIDLAEAVLLSGRVGERFSAVVTDMASRGVRIQLADVPVVGVIEENGLAPGDAITVLVEAADPQQRRVEFSLAGQ